jgi:hypothetical protein
MKAEALLADRGATELGTGYRLFGDSQVTIIRVTVTNTSPNLVYLSFKASGTWVYALPFSVQEHIKSLIAGKTSKEAIRTLASLPGIAQASIAWDENSRLPKDRGSIHLIIRVLSGRAEP